MVVASSATCRRGRDREIMFYTYVLKSIKNGNLYVGSTNDLRRRFKEHNSGQGGEYTRKNKPFVLIYYEAYLLYKDAQASESFFKTGYGKEVLKSKLKNFLENK